MNDQDAWRASGSQVPYESWSKGRHRTSANKTGGASHRPTQRVRRSSDQSSQTFGDPATNAYRDQYVNDAKLGVAGARAKYRTQLRLFWTLRFGVIGSGLAVAVLAAVTAPAWLVASFGALAASLETIITVTHLQENAIAHGELSEGMARELRDYELRVGTYSSGDVIGSLHERIEGLREQATKERFRLARSSAISEPPASSPTT
jgi:hypothetical protein